MKMLYSVSITIGVLIIFLITLYFYIQYKAAERVSSGSISPTISLAR